MTTFLSKFVICSPDERTKMLERIAAMADHAQKHNQLLAAKAWRNLYEIRKAEKAELEA